MSGSTWLGVGLIGLALLLFLFSILVSIPDTGDSTNWYMWAVLGASLASLVGGVVALQRGRSRRTR